MKTLLALVAVAVILFVALNHERFFQKRALRPDVVNTPLRSLPPLPDKEPSALAAPLPLPVADTNNPAATAVGAPPATTIPASAWETTVAQHYSSIIEKIRKERAK